MGYLNDDGLRVLLSKFDTRFDQLEDKISGIALTPGTPLPIYDESTGRYTNDSIVKWMDNFADSKVYGIQITKGEIAESPFAAKTGANEGLVLEPSTNDTMGRNDYIGKKLFWCHRVNGGVDVNGIPYVTAIEYLDDKFDPYTQNTWALTPVYYYRYTEDDTNYYHDYCDSPMVGFQPCVGAYTYAGLKRPYILRACYQASMGSNNDQYNSLSGKVPYISPGAGSTQPGMSQWGLVKDMINTKDAHGIGYLSYGDWGYRNEFMQLMLGYKAPKELVTGNLEKYDSSSPSSSGSNTNFIYVAGNYTARARSGYYISVNSTNLSTASSTNFGSIAKRRKIISSEYSSSKTTIKIDGSPITYTTSNYIFIGECPTGICDNVKGTYGSLTVNSLKDRYTPYKFQNVEWGNGYSEVIVDAYTHFASSDSDYRLLLIPDKGDMYETEFMVSNNLYNIQKYPCDFEIMHGVWIPKLFTTSWRYSYYVGFYGPTSSGNKSIIIDSDRSWFENSNSTFGGIGFMHMRNGVATQPLGLATRISSIIDKKIS